MKRNDLPKPFVKWAGGKRQLLKQFETLYPQSFNNYYEPFLGGGAVFFDLYKQGKLKKRVFLNDNNDVLMQTYQDIKTNLDELLPSLKNIADEYPKTDQKRKDFYYERRDEFNELITSEGRKNKKMFLRQSTLFIFLNRTGFNGMYRVNSKGEFNIPAGKYVNPNICDEENLKAISEALIKTKAKLTSKDFSEVYDSVSRNDFVYFDPPYYPLDKTSSFTSYTKEDFKHNEQVTLAYETIKLSRKGCLVMQSNSDAKEIKTLYKGLKSIVPVEANRAINSKASKRGKINEVVIKNY